MKQNILSFGFVCVSLLVVVVLVLTREDDTEIRSRAAQESPVVLRNITAPSVRLISSDNRLLKGEKVPIDIYAQAPNMQIVETKITLDLDSRYFTVAENDIENGALFPIYLVHSITENQVSVSFFVAPEAGYEPVQLDKETLIGRIYVRAKTENTSNGAIQINRSLSGLYPARMPDGSIASHQLNTVEGISFIIE